MTKAWQAVREPVSFDVEDDEGMCFQVYRTKNGSLTAHVRACGRVTVDGREYTYDRAIHIKLKTS